MQPMTDLYLQVVVPIDLYLLYTSLQQLLNSLSFRNLLDLINSSTLKSTNQKTISPYRIVCIYAKYPDPRDLTYFAKIEKKIKIAIKRVKLKQIANFFFFLCWG